MLVEGNNCNNAWYRKHQIIAVTARDLGCRRRLYLCKLASSNGSPRFFLSPSLFPLSWTILYAFVRKIGSSTPPLIEVSRALSRATIWHEDFASRNDFYSTPFNPPSPRGATLFTARTRSMDHHRRNTYTCLLRVSSLLSLSTATRHHGFTLSLFRMWRAININEAGWSLQRNKGRVGGMRVCTCVCRACGTIRREQTHACIASDVYTRFTVLKRNLD